MSIYCMICNEEFKMMITSTHLKKHGIKSDEYKKLYGDLVSDEFRQKRSIQNTGENNPNYKNKWTEKMKTDLSKIKLGQIPWNKGIEVKPSQKFLVSIKKREEKYLSGELIRKGSPKTNEQKQILSQRAKEYALKNPIEMRERANKAVKTKIDIGYDFGKNMRGRKHNKETKKKISIILEKNNLIKSEKSKEHLIENAAKAQCTIIDFENQYLLLKCNNCRHEFRFTKQYFTNSKLKLDCCSICFPKNPQYRSKGEIELFNFIRSLDSTAIHSMRQLISRKEIDIYLPSKKIAFEYNGLYWHSEQQFLKLGKSKTSDNEKRIELKKLGIRYIGIFEDEWLNHRDIVESRIKNLLGKSENNIYARKCIIDEVTPPVASEFCKINHIQGRGRSNVRYGLFYNGELVSLMTFSKNNLSRKINDWEINRFCSKLNFNVVGGASRLFKHFIKIHRPPIVISYSDNRWSIGGLYQTLGFEFSHETTPNYWYLLPNCIERIHRFKLRKDSSNKEITEFQLRESQGFKRIWDCGSTKWSWKRPWYFYQGLFAY